MKDEMREICLISAGPHFALQDHYSIWCKGTSIKHTLLPLSHFGFCSMKNGPHENTSTLFHFFPSFFKLLILRVKSATS